MYGSLLFSYYDVIIVAAMMYGVTVVATVVVVTVTLVVWFGDRCRTFIVTSCIVITTAT